MKASWTVVRAAAGCGKTTDLALRWLELLAGGIAPEELVTITFTRRAAAELGERVALALRACIDDEGGAAARAALGPVAPRYAEVAPRDPQVARRALERLPDAPIGTTDAFVQRLLTEFALDAALHLPDGGRVPLDIPIAPGPGMATALQRAARRVLDPPGGGVDPDVAQLVSAWTFDELVEAVSRRERWSDLRLASTREVLALWTEDLARVVLRHDLAGLVGLDPAHVRDAAAWGPALAAVTNETGQWAVGPIADWLASGAEPSVAPWTLFGWLVSLHLSRKPGRVLKAALTAEVRSAGPGRLDLWQIVSALRYPYDDPAMVDRADELRRARDRVRRRVTALGLREAALAGDLSYDELLEAAIQLVEQPPARLCGRFRALLVDEIQDANPQQLRLYRALASLPDTEAYFVGDSRQSIYLFRDAEPEGLRDLESETGRARDLLVNHRSAPRLVEAHRGLFDALAAPMREQRWRPIDDLALLGSDPGNEALAVPGDEPVWIVVPEPKTRVWEDQLDDRVLYAFLERLDRLGSVPGHEAETAVVLTPSWSVARRACEAIRAWRGRQDAAFVEGVGRGAPSRVVEDVVLLLRALSDDEDDVAWLGLWKHPAVGLSDAALARAASDAGLLVRSGDPSGSPLVPAPAPARGPSRPGRLLRADALGPPHGEDDQWAFARAVGPLRAARRELGRGATSEVLDRLITALDWRVVLGAGPGGADDLAELSVLLDWIRDRDGEGLAPEAVRAALLDERTERPQVHVGRPRGHVACTTVFQAKGLAWDHVAVLRPGQSPGGGRVPPETAGWMVIGEERLRLDGLHFDPRGGLSPFRDPIGRLAARLQRLRTTEECARLAYVAVTRARRTVTLGLLPKRKLGARSEPELKDLLPDAWLANPIPGVAVVERPAPPPPPPPPPRHAAPTGPELPERAPPGGRWYERAPSSLGAHLDADARQRTAEWVVGRVRLVNGLHLGRGPAAAPPGTHPRTGLPIAGHRLQYLRPTDWGNLAHGWFASWAFREEPDRATVETYLAREWGAADPEVAEWLVAVCAGLRRSAGPLWQLVTDPSVRLHFEHPLLGLGRADQADVLLSGRVDLLVEHGRRWFVVDFKAGARAPTGWRDLVEGASLRTYAFQLHAYADALRRSGRQVEAVALWFVRDGTSVRWSP